MVRLSASACCAAASYPLVERFLQSARVLQDCGDGFPMDENELDGEPIDLATPGRNLTGILEQAWILYETVPSFSNEMFFSGDIYNAVEMAKQSPEVEGGSLQK